MSGPGFDHYPRDARNRYRIITLKGNEVRTLCTTDSKEGVGVAIVTLAEEGELDGRSVGVLDVLGEKGKCWLVNPWTKGPA